MSTESLPLHPRRDEADALPVVEPPMHHHEFRHGLLHAERDERRNEETPTTREVRGHVLSSLGIRVSFDIAYSVDRTEEVPPWLIS